MTDPNETLEQNQLTAKG